MKRIRRAGAAVLVAAAILLSACGGLNPEEIAGRYTLTRVNGVTIPDFVDIGDVALEVLGGWWQINSDFTWSSHFETGTTIADNSGTYRFEDILIIFSDDSPLTTTGSVVENSLTIQDVGIVWFFEK